MSDAKLIESIINEVCSGKSWTPSYLARHIDSAISNKKDKRIYHLENQLAEKDKEIDRLREDAQHALSTVWRFIGAFKGENGANINLCLKSAEYHLRKLDYVFDEPKTKG